MYVIRDHRGTTPCLRTQTTSRNSTHVSVLLPWLQGILGKQSKCQNVGICGHSVCSPGMVQKAVRKITFYIYFPYIGNGFRYHFQRWYIYGKNAWMLVKLEVCQRLDNHVLCIQDVNFHFLTDMTWFTETVACHQQTQFHSMWNQPVSTIVLYQLIKEPSPSAGRHFKL